VHFTDYSRKKHRLIFNSAESITQELPKRVDNGIKTKRAAPLSYQKCQNIRGDQSGKLIKNRANFSLSRNPGDKRIFRCFRSLSLSPTDGVGGAVHLDGARALPLAQRPRIFGGLLLRGQAVLAALFHFRERRVN
jgi:hypothetical protein